MKRYIVPKASMLRSLVWTYSPQGSIGVWTAGIPHELNVAIKEIERVIPYGTVIAEDIRNAFWDSVARHSGLPKTLTCKEYVKILDEE